MKFSLSRDTAEAFYRKLRLDAEVTRALSFLLGVGEQSFLYLFAVATRSVAGKGL